MISYSYDILSLSQTGPWSLVDEGDMNLIFAHCNKYYYAVM